MKPEVICYMMSSVNGRIDCAMTEKIEGSKEYYEILNEFDFDATISGHTTAAMHYAKDDHHPVNVFKPMGKRSVFMAKENVKYTVILDTKGTLSWNMNEIDGTHLVIALSEAVNEEYLGYLRSQGISYIVTGHDSIDLGDLLETLNETFHVRRAGLVGGGKANGAFLKEGLIDGLCLLIGPGIDARSGEPNLFDGFLKDEDPVTLSLKSFKTYPDGAVYLTYQVGK